MKRIIFLICFSFLICTQISYAQWFPQNSGITSNINSVTFIDELTGWAAGAAGVILKTTDGGNNWIPLSTGITNDLYSIHFENNNLGWAAGKNATIINTTNGGTSWQSQTANPPIGDIRSVYFTSLDSGWTTGYNEYSPGNFDSYISHTINGGTTWEDNYDIMDEKMFSIMFPNTANGWNAGTAIYNTTDGGLNWVGSGAGSGVEFHSVFFANESTGWITGGNIMMNIGIVINTTNGGLTWSPPITLPSPANSIFFTEIGNGWVVGSGGEIYYTSDGGAAWYYEASNVTSNLNSVYFINDLIGWTVGSNGVILKTINGGTPVELTSFTYKIINENVELNWTTETETNNKGFNIERQVRGRQPSVGNSVWVNVGFINGNGTTTEEHSYFFLDKNVGPGNYTYRLKQVDFDGSYIYSKEIEVNVTAPTEFSLEQNYPNPFNPTTNIQYRIPNKEFVSLKVYDVLGNEVATLVNEEKPAGSYTVKFSAQGESAYGRDGGNLPSGVYICRLMAGIYSASKKLLLLK